MKEGYRKLVAKFGCKSVAKLLLILNLCNATDNAVSKNLHGGKFAAIWLQVAKDNFFISVSYSKYNY